VRISEGFPAKSASLAIGLLSLGAETLWVRIFSFMGRSTPLAVSIILGTYLLGIAFGAVLGGRLCRHQDEKKLAVSLIASLLVGSIIVLASPLMLVTVTKSTTSHSYSIILPAVAALSLAFLSSFVFSICFPICHHLGTKLASGNVGKGMSRVYAANIAGSVIGPLLVNFVILQFATTELAFAILGILGVAVGMLLLGFAESRKPLKFAAATCVLLAVASVFAMARSDNWLIRSLASKPYDPDPSRVFDVSRVVETRQGIIVSYRDDKSGDIIYGGNVYDGRTNLDPRLNSNNINRVLVLAALRPNPKRVLVIGLSIGSWNYLLSGFPGVEQIDVVEINPGYLQLIAEYPKQSEVMNDPRVRLHIGDGRRFLRKIPEGTYDLVVMNTSFHWRAYASMLLSKEFLTLARSRMAPGGLLAFNTTGSRDALYTAASVFPHAYLYDNFAICADSDWRAALEKPEAVRELMMVSPAKAALFSNDDSEIIKGFLSRSHTADVPGLAAKIGRPLEVITDRNLITEHKYGRPLKPTDMGEGR
jgi:spermidine synthase/predicted MFS family arabinose efflux permease